MMASLAGQLVLHAHHYLALLRKELNTSLGFCLTGAARADS